MIRRWVAFVADLFAERFDYRPISDVAGLSRFVRTRAAYVAQTSLYGYLKTRMGTSFQRHFEDDDYAASIRASAVLLYMSCLADLTVFAVASVNRASRLTVDEAEALALRCYRDALADGIPEPHWAEDSAQALDRFGTRAKSTIWGNVVIGEAAFAGSADDLIRLAPVVDEFKRLDREFVTNSIRFRWRDVREQFRRRVDGAAIRDDWQRISEQAGVDAATSGE